MLTPKSVLTIIALISVIAIYFPTRHARHYNYIKAENVISELVFFRNSSSQSCDYHKLILNNKQIDISDVFAEKTFRRTAKGGEFIPSDCQPLLKVALVVPYRNRREQLGVFLNYMHSFLQSQRLWYRIFVVNQTNFLPFNRAQMFNYGAKVAISMGFPCLILHDVDLMPINTGNVYGCGRSPRHMSSSLDTFRFNLPYLTLFGGAVAILRDHFLEINGLSNLFYGWGGEDDDFYKRLQTHNLLPMRFEADLSKYTMLAHKKEKASQERYNNLKYSVERHKTDGINSLTNNFIVKLEDLYTVVNVM